jgi:hypothetical protein
MNTPYLPTTLREASIGPVWHSRPGHYGWADFAARLRALTSFDVACVSSLEQTILCDSRFGNAIAIADGMLDQLITLRRH